MWKFEKRAGLVLDAQDDPGFAWEEISQFWPDDLGMPDVGIEVEEKHCIASLVDEDGISKTARYPINTPENALASSMYFLRHGIHSIEKKAHQHIAAGLKNARVAWDVRLPDEFVEFVKHAAYEPMEEEETFADDDGHLPVTTPEQCAASVKMFQKHASKWNAEDRMIIGRKLKGAVDHHEIGLEVPYSGDTLSKNASGALDIRRRAMEGMHQHPNRLAYLSEIEDLKEELSDMQTYRDLLKAAAYLEDLDKQAQMDIGWGVHFPDPVDTFIEGFSEDFLPALSKTASDDDYDSVDFSGLSGTFEQDVVDQISESPSHVIPTLPLAQKRIVEDYIKSRR